MNVSSDLLGDPALDDIWNDATFDPAWFNIDPETYYSNNNNSCGFIPNAENIDGVDRATRVQSTSPAVLDVNGGTYENEYASSIARSTDGNVLTRSLQSFPGVSKRNAH